MPKRIPFKIRLIHFFVFICAIMVSAKRANRNIPLNKTSTFITFHHVFISTTFGNSSTTNWAFFSSLAYFFLPSLQIIPLNPFKRKKIHEKVIKVFSKFLILIAIVFLKFSRYPFILGKILQTF